MQIIDGTIRFADYKNYRYQNIVVKGKLDKKLFEGVASIRDANADLTLNGIIDFNSPDTPVRPGGGCDESEPEKPEADKRQYRFRGQTEF